MNNDCVPQLTKIEKAARYALTMWRTGTRRYARTIATAYPTDHFRKGSGPDYLFFNELELDAPPRAALILLGYYPLAVQLKSRAQVTFTVDEGLLIAQVGKIRLCVESSEEIFILHELLVRRIYPYVWDKPALLLDIGMNAGFSSLFFAANPNVESWGFEPFPQTLVAAQRNLSLNPEISARIKPHHFGLGASDTEECWDYVPDWRGSCGTWGLHLRAESKAIEKVKVQLKRASPVVEAVREQHPDRILVAKIDCEGGEYAIIQDLVDSGRIDLIDCVMMEWHRHPAHDPLTIMHSLQAAGFFVFSIDNDSLMDGMYFASRRGVTREMSQ